MHTPIRVAIVDPHDIVRDALKIFLETADPLEFAGEAASCDEALALCERAVPEVILCDCFVQPDVGLRLISTICRRFPQICVIVLTTLLDAETAARVLEAGAQGCLTKRISIDDLAEAIVSARQGTLVLDVEIAGLLNYVPKAPWKIVASLTLGGLLI